MKECIICKRSFDEKHSLQKFCSKQCFTIHRKMYQRIQKQQPKYKEYAKQYRLKNGKTDKTKQYNRIYMSEYRKLDKYKIQHKLIQKKYEKTDRYKELRSLARKTEAYKQSQKKYQKSLLGILNSLRGSVKRREAKENVIHNFTSEDWLLKLKQSKGICPGINGICLSGDPNVGLDKLSFDHIYPISLASLDYKRTGIKRVYTIDDIQPLCLKCNISKGNKILSKPKGL